MSYEEPAGPGRRRRGRRARPPRRRHEALPVRGRTDGPPRRNAEAPDGPGFGPIPEPRVHPEPRGPVRPRDNPRDGPRGEREGHPLLPVLPGRTPPGSRTRGGLARVLTHANVGRRVDRHRPRYDRGGRPASRSPRSPGVDTGGRRGSVQRPGVGGVGARPRDLDRDRPRDRRPTAMGIVGPWARGSLLVPHANGRPARPRRGARPRRRGIGRPIVRGPPRPAARRRSQREDRPRSSASGPPPPRAIRFPPGHRTVRRSHGATRRSPVRDRAVIASDTVAAAFIGRNPRARVPMAVPGKTRGRARASAANVTERKAPSEQNLRLAWGLFLLIGVPLGLLAALAPLTAAGIYIEPLRQFWRPWPPDILKPVIGVAGFAASLGYLCYRLGRHAGYRWGTAASVAMARNIAEGRASAPATVVPRERAPTLPEPPTPRP